MNIWKIVFNVLILVAVVLCFYAGSFIGLESPFAWGSVLLMLLFLVYAKPFMEKVIDSEYKDMKVSKDTK